MDKCRELAVKAGEELCCSIETLEKLCRERAASKMSYSKYRRLATELGDLSKLLKTFIKYDTLNRNVENPTGFQQ